MPEQDKDFVFEVAVNPEGTVAINIKDFPQGPDGWGHLTFTVHEAMELVNTLTEATLRAHQVKRDNAGLDAHPLIKH